MLGCRRWAVEEQAMTVKVRRAGGECRPPQGQNSGLLSQACKRSVRPDRQGAPVSRSRAGDAEGLRACPAAHSQVHGFKREGHTRRVEDPASGKHQTNVACLPVDNPFSADTICMDRTESQREIALLLS